MMGQMSDVRDTEVPEPDAFEQSVPVADLPEDEPVEVLSADLEAPEPDVFEQHQPAVGYDDDSWR